ncbi:MAG: MJ0042-type zinc finger domain-containing protein [Fimbriiglobus sp.]
MAISTCPHCSARLSIGSDLIGEEVECGSCGRTFVARTKSAPVSEPDDVSPFRMQETSEPDFPEDNREEKQRPGRRRRSRRDRHAEDYEDGVRTCRPAAIGLVVACTIGLLFRLFDLFLIITDGNGAMGFAGGGGGAGAGGGPPDPDFELGSMIGAGAAILMTPIAFVGAIQMLRMKSYGFAMTAAVLSVIPCTGCCCLNMPMGIWAVVVLVDPVVRRAFEVNAGR